MKDILFFDSKCLMCEGLVKFFLKIDKSHILYYAPLQGETAKDILKEEYYQNLNTAVLYTKGKIFTKSDAILRSLMLLGGIYSFFALFLLVPKFLRNFIYDFIAKTRYKFFGEKEACLFLDDKQRARMLH